MRTDFVTPEGWQCGDVVFFKARDNEGFVGVYIERNKSKGVIPIREIWRKMPYSLFRKLRHLEGINPLHKKLRVVGDHVFIGKTLVA